MVSSIGPGGRGRPPEATLAYAKQWAAAAGINEVTEITEMDKLGVHVFVSIRPQASADCYTFGKGLRRIDAEVGAYLEALEYFFAEPGMGRISTHWGTARNVAGHEEADDAILDFAPLLQREIDLDAPLLLASVQDLESGERRAVPAELIYCPAPDVGESLFGASTNGLATGNSLLEASFHALVEVIERDIWSFEFVHQNSRLVEPSSLPDEVREIVERAERSGLQLKVRTLPNDYGMPFFVAFIYDDNNPCRKNFNGGWGCDLNRRTALLRAVTEAAQSRLAFIHGGRKVPKLGVSPIAPEAQEDEVKLVRQNIRGVSDTRRQIKLAEIPDVAVGGSITEQLQAVIERLRLVSPKPIYRAVYTPVDAPLQVVRVVVPLLESFQETRNRVGRRLKAAIDSRAVQAC